MTSLLALLKCGNANRFARAYSVSRKQHLMKLIGNREQVTYGKNGEPCYFDSLDIPFPAIRYMEPTPEIMALRGKERGDWRLVTIDEKKMLYRASFCQTYAEFKRDTGEWKSQAGWVIFSIALGLWYYIFEKLFVYNPIPDSYKNDHVRAQLRRIIDMHNNPITGLSSKWDYEKKDWKKGAWFVPPNPFKGECDEIEENDYTP